MHSSPRPIAIGTIAVTVVLAAVAGLALWQAREFSAFGSIFPFVIGGALLFGCAVLLARELFARGSAVATDGDATADARSADGLRRSLALIAVLVAWAISLEWVGFVVASWLGFLVLAIIADTERPSLRGIALYAVAAAGVVGGLKLLFQYALKVRLPAGELITRLIG